MITHYLFYISHSLNTKNKLEAAVCEYLYKMDGSLIDASEKKEFQQLIVAEIEKLNQQYSRCKPIKPGWDNYEKEPYNEHERTIRIPLWGVHFITSSLIGAVQLPILLEPAKVKK